MKSNKLVKKSSSLGIKHIKWCIFHLPQPLCGGSDPGATASWGQCRRAPGVGDPFGEGLQMTSIENPVVGSFKVFKRL